MDLSILITADGPRNCAVQITGYGPLAWTEIIDAADMQHGPDYFVVDAVYWMVQDKTEVQIAWSGGDASVPFLPLAGRGRNDFSEVKGLRAPNKESASRLSISAFGEGLFTVVLDFSKHIGV